ncbi:2-amino-4-hydroxy-6-hydroxymethyldihydropteridine diphosphokinase [Oceanobacter mangrovi]|uniref:2-amino-4-hydroxy-6- hydroxymethyldihydropteridine diphosphokinase n=1 Tax=Oceanobacter mangrovi TaxID=2862510 RepID=UPI001C8E6FF5|nr:2-amino-4-hydroxy-6-hydroxymethyldihydropteridine diphosphokinase [Oceanobacter mangrovi]
MAICYLGLGANLQQPYEQLRSCLAALESQPDLELLDWSSFYGSKPVGPQDQPDYVNAVARIRTELAPTALLDCLQAIENQQGRVRLRRWGERTLDIDILLIDQLQLNSERLTVPHIEMANRLFVLQPLAELAPELQLPDGRLLAPLIAAITDQPPLLPLGKPARHQLENPAAS